MLHLSVFVWQALNDRLVSRQSFSFFSHVSLFFQSLAFNLSYFLQIQSLKRIKTSIRIVVGFFFSFFLVALQ